MLHVAAIVYKFGQLVFTDGGPAKAVSNAIYHLNRHLFNQTARHYWLIYRKVGAAWGKLFFIHHKLNVEQKPLRVRFCDFFMWLFRHLAM